MLIGRKQGQWGIPQQKLTLIVFTVRSIGVQKEFKQFADGALSQAMFGVFELKAGDAMPSYLGG